MDHSNELPDMRNIDHPAVMTLVRMSMHAGAWLKAAETANRDTLLAALAQCGLQGLEDQRTTALTFWLEQNTTAPIVPTLERGNDQEQEPLEGQLMPNTQDDETLIPNLPALSQGVKDHHAAMLDIDASFGDGEKYDKNRLINETRFFLNHAADSVIEAGKRLVRLKEHEVHGDFLPALERIGIDERAARRLMTVATKFGVPNRTTLSDLGKTKMLELAILDDEELDGLAKGQTVRGLKVEELERMSVRELRAALRESKLDAALERDKLKDQITAKEREKAALQQIIDTKNNLLDTRAVQRQTAEGREAELNELKQRLNNQALTAVGNVNALWFQFADLKEAMGEKHQEEFKLLCAISLGQIAVIVRTLGEEWEVVPDMDAPSVFDAAITNPDAALFNDYMKSKQEIPPNPPLVKGGDNNNPLDRSHAPRGNASPGAPRLAEHDNLEDGE